MTRRILTACFAALLIFCGLELAARNLLFPQYTAMLPDMYAPHPILGHFNKPNLTVRRYNPMNYDVANRTNRLGLRGSDKNLEESLAGIWVAGASNTFGGFVQDDETYAAQLQRYGYRSANLASEGHGIVNQMLVIRMLTEQGYRPRAVILGITMYQAVSDYSSSRDSFTRPLGGNVQPAAAKKPRPRDNLRRGIDDLVGAFPTALQPVRARLLKSSALYGWLKVGIMGVPALRDFTLQLGLRNDLYLVRNFDLNLLRPLTSDNPATANIASTADYIAAMKDWVTEKLGVPFGVVMLPSLQQMEPDSLRRFRAHYGLDEEDLDAERTPAALRRALQTRAVPVLDILPRLLKEIKRRRHFPDDGHMTAASHEVVGRALTEWLAAGLNAGSPIPPADRPKTGARE